MNTDNTQNRKLIGPGKESPNLGVRDRLVGVSDSISKVRTFVRQVAPTKISVLISGGSGTGKEVVAKMIHDLSPRRDTMFVPVNCGAIPEGLFESEVFGHERGSFTGADRQRKGYFERADGGTLFLDEIGEMPLAMQVKVLRALEDGEYYRIGGTKPLRADVRIVAATNRDLAKEVEAGKFREDLYFRLRAVDIFLPPLNERKEDIPPLVNRFAEEFFRENQIPGTRILPEGMEEIQNWVWPGNVRELRHFVGTLLTLEHNSPIDSAAVRRHLPRSSISETTLPVLAPLPREGLDNGMVVQLLIDMRRDIQELKEMVARALLLAQYPTALPEHVSYREESEQPIRLTLEEIERDQIHQALKELDGNRRKAAQALGIGERTLYRKIKEYNL
ncbi:MAG: sigma-54 dependent transcriptional regulator [Candidatus Electryonea clarkiae]|nr:sigma-54 dependent transcriptional regulator [Candidatus Electryonea clarkiae]MDP8286844.1 sigma-54 dependent transcriptional regulator [Candidatus Electryonea clarkiae]